MRRRKRRGDSNDLSSASHSNPVSQAASLLTPSATPQAVTATGNAGADGFAFVNAMRQNVGLTPALTSDSALVASSQDHAVYLVDNDASGHTETQGLRGFTGATLTNRAPGATAEVTVSGDPASFPSSLTAVETIFDAPYHRFLMLDNFAGMGVGSAANASWDAFNIDFGGISGTSLGDTQLVAYPYPGETGVPERWYAAESPNPFASQPQYENTEVGYPITVQGNVAGKLSGVTFVLTDSGGANVTCVQNTPDTDGNLNNGAMCIPFAPLKENTTYTVHVTGVLTTDAAHAIDQSWSFTTGLAAVMNVQPAVPQNGTRPPL